MSGLPGGLGPELFLVDFLCRLGLGRNSGGCTFYTSDGCYLHLLFVVFRCLDCSGWELRCFSHALLLNLGTFEDY